MNHNPVATGRSCAARRRAEVQPGAGRSDTSDRLHSDGVGGPRGTKSSRERGFVTLTTVIILIAVGLATTIGMLSLLASSQDIEEVQRSGLAASWLADACAEHARAGLRGASYSGDETLTLGAGSCRVLSLSQTATASYEVQAVASVSQAFARVLVVFEVAADASGSVQSVTERSWDRVADF